MKNLFSYYLKSTILVVLISFVSLLSAQNSRINLQNNWGKQGLSIKAQKSSGLTLNSSVTSYELVPTLVDNETLQTVLTDGVNLQNNEGAPNLPAFSNYIAIPQGATVKAKVINMETELVQNINVAPAPIIPKENDDRPLIYSRNSKIYNKDALYPNNVVQVSSPMKIRGMDVVLIGVSPFQYNPVTQQLVINKNIEIEITYEGGNGQYGEDRLRNRWWDPIIQDAVLNQNVITKVSKSVKVPRQTGCEYLIIVPDDPVFLAWADSLKIFRNRQGILTEIITTTEIGGNTVNAIESYIDNAYLTWDIPPAAVLLMADFGTSGSTIISPIYNNYCASDNIFADVDNDQMPDIIFARMTAQNEGHLETYVTKVLNYETTPPTNPDFYDHPITALGWQTERWFQICSEAVGGYFKNIQGKDPVRINAVYGGNPSVDPWSTATNTTTIMNYFGPDGLGYLPATPAELGGWTGGDANDVNNAINSGAFILQHRDHGNVTVWGEPYYVNNNVNGLTNTDLSFIFSINCLTGKYNISQECLTEKFHRHKYNGENSGALGLIAASETSYSFVNDTYVWGMYDNMWPDFLPDYGTTPDSRGVLPAFGNAAGKYFLQQSSWPYNVNNKEVTYNLFHHHGDAFSVVYSEMPQYLTVVHDQGIVAGATSFAVTADEGSFIALTVDNVIIGTADGTGSPVPIQIQAQYPPDEILVTITKQNYYRYESFVPVIPPSGPFIIYNELLINNPSGMMNTGEEIVADITVKNIGVEVGENIVVNLSSSDPYIEITDNTEDYGNIEANATVTIPEGFSWNVASNIPDMYMAQFEVESTNGTETWESLMMVIGHAPVLKIGNLTVDDSAQGDGNGIPDPGETVVVKIETYNNGSAEALNTISNLMCYSPYVDIVDNQISLGDITSNGMAEATFTISISASAPIGSILEFDFDVVSGEYTDEKTFNEKAGLIVEDWETGTMSKYPWTTGGTGEWAVTLDDPYEGTYCNKTTDLNHQQSTYMSIIYESAMENDSISFYVKVSSESGYDFFKFSIDGMNKTSLSGEVDWQRVAFPVSPGIHLFKWEYYKDINQSAGEDCARVDYIILPTPVITSAFAGNDTEFCSNDIMECQGVSTNCESVMWETLGTGTFSDPQINTPIYTPSEQDLMDGSVNLVFTGHGPVIDVTDTVNYSFTTSPSAYAGEGTTICSDVHYLLETAEADNYSSVLWTTTGDGTFDDDAIVTATYTPGVVDVENGMVTLTLTSTGSEACTPATSDIELFVNQATTAIAGADADICPMLTYTISDAVVENYVTIEWTTTGDGTFDNATIANPTYTPGDNDKETKEVTLSLAATNDYGCPTAVDEILLTLYCTDISEIGNKIGINLYPNPNHGNFTLKLDRAPMDNANIYIYNSVGKIVYSELDVKINEGFTQMVSFDAQAGIYTIKVEGSNFITNTKFIVM